MRRLLVLGICLGHASALAACGLSVVGERLAPDETTEIDASEPNPPGRDARADDASRDAGDGGVVVVDAGEDAPVEPPIDAGSPIIYAASVSRFWTFVPTTGTWAGGTADLPTGGCSKFADLAVDSAGHLFGVQNDGTGLYVVNPSDPALPTCTTVASDAGVEAFPTAIAFTPRGTLSATAEVLVGYTDDGDYVRINTASGAVTKVKTGALAGFTVGDIVNVGKKGYVAMTGGSCGSSQCFWEIDFATGMRIGAAPLGTAPATKVVTGLGHWGGKVYAFTDDTDVYAVDPANPSAAVLVPGPMLGGVTVSFVGAASAPAAPTTP